VTHDPTQVSVLDPREREELEALRAEVAVLRRTAADSLPAQRRASASAPPRSWAARGRTTSAVVLIVLGVLLAPLSVAAVWSRGMVADTDRYVQTVAPLAQNPAVQDAIAADITNRVFEAVDVQGLTQQALAALGQRGSLPPAIATQLQALAVPLANGVRGFAEDQVQTVVRSDVFARAWVEANRAAHQQLVAALTGEGSSALKVQGNTVSVDMSQLLTVVKQRLVSSGFQLAEKIPVVDAQFTVFQSADVAKVQRGFNVLSTLGLWLPFVCVLLLGLGIYLARNHRRAFLGAGLGLALVMLATAAGLALARRAYLDGMPSDVLPQDAAAAIFDTLVRFLQDTIRAGVLLGVLVAAGAFLVGPSVTAVTLRRWGDTALGAAQGGLVTLGLDVSPVTRWVAPRLNVLRGAVLVAALVIVLLQRYKTLELVSWTAVGALVALLLLQFLATAPRPRRAQPVLTAPAPVAAG
jgi:hypothetical protein